MHGVTDAELGNFTIGIQIESFFKEMANQAVAKRKEARGEYDFDTGDGDGEGDGENQC